MKEKPLQIFTDEYLEYCKKLTPEQIIEFLESFRQIAYAGDLQRKKSKLISIKVPLNLLIAFKHKAKMKGRPYQSIIKSLMQEWVIEGS